MTTWHAANEALGYFFQWPVILFPVAGSFIGMFFGAMPGLGGVVAVALLIPLTLSWEAHSCMLLLASVVGGTAFGGSISAILINTPGTGPNACTCFDGYPMAQKGEAGKAIGISATSSACGALFGLMIFVALLPVAKKIVLAFASPEFAMMTLLGLTVIAVVSRGDMIKGLIAGGIGLMFSFIGFDPVTGNLRYLFGTKYLWDGVKLMPAIIGLFAIAEAIDLSVKGGTIVLDKQTYKSKGALQGAKEVAKHWTVFLRSSLIGTLIGAIPGVGGTAANYLAYAQAVQTSKDPEKFGTGDPRGIIASESSNDAKDGGALLPTVVFGIPGSEVWAVVLVGLLLHGLNPGPELLGPKLDILFTLVFALVFSNILVAAVGIAIANPLSRITVIRVSLLVPVIIIVSLVGAFAVNRQIGDVVMALILGIMGYWFKKCGYARVSIIIALILGKIFETSLHRSLQAYDYRFIFRPITFVILIAIIFTLALPFMRTNRRRLKP